MKGNRVKCYCCGTETAKVYVRPFGRDATGAVASWVCHDCDQAAMSTQQAPGPIRGRPALRMATVLRAEALSRLGFGATPDLVMRRALDLLESRVA